MAAFQPNPDPGFFGTLSGLFGGLDRFEEQQRLAAARAAALRGQSLQPPQQPQIEQAQSAILSDVGGGATGSWDAPPQQPAPPPMPAQPQAPSPAPQQPTSRLPRALAAAAARPQPPQPMPQQQAQAAPGAPIEPQPAPDPFQARDSALQAQYAAATADLNRQMQPPDFAQAQEAYERRAQAAPQNLLLALAATEAGREFQPLASHFMRQAAEAQSPMKTAGGTMTPEGFVQDPTFGHALQVRSAEARVASIERAMQANITAADRQRLERERRQAQAELQQERLALQAQLAAQADETRRFVAGLTHGDRQAKANEPKHLPAAQTNAYVGNQTSIANIDAAIKALEANPDATGFKGYLPNVALSRMGTAGERATRADIANIGSLKIHDRSGAAVTIAETPRLLPFIPTVNDDPKTALIKLRQLKAEAERANLTIEGFASENAYRVPGRTQVTPQATAPAAAPAAGGLPPGWSVTTK